MRWGDMGDEGQSERDGLASGRNAVAMFVRQEVEKYHTYQIVVA